MASNFTNLSDLGSNSSGEAPSWSRQDTLNTLTWVSCGLTCLACLLTVMIYIGYRLLQSSRCMLRISFLAMLCTTEAFFVAGMKFTELTAVCTAMAAILHFSCIATFSCLLCYILYLGNELKGGELSYFLFGMIGYVVPACIVLITVIWRYTDYRDDNSCWISSDNYLDWTLKGPIVVLTLVCSVILLHVLLLAVKVTSEKERTVKKMTRSGIRSCCVILPATGATWILGAFTVTDRREHVWIQALFTATNLLLGVAVLLFMCLLNGEVREVRRMKQLSSVSTKKRQEMETGHKMRQGINVIFTGRDLHTAQTPHGSPRRERYQPLTGSSPDLSEDRSGAPLASVEDVTLGSREVLDLPPIQRSSSPGAPPVTEGGLGGDGNSDTQL